MLKDVVSVKVLGGYRVHLCFEDGLEGELDLGSLIDFRGVFAQLRNEAEFAKVCVDTDLGTIAWPGGADIDPDVLYSAVSGDPISLKSAKDKL